ncbi:MAG: tail fiber domain-containing protein [Elusimicrobia bacterium]|nr:tail fiber domain-containing protein [Candidatus Liberimonas magnetica]
MVDTYIQDADQDTKVQTEANSDEDKIRFTTAGTQRAIILNTGDVGIGKNPTRRLDVLGDICSDIGEASASGFMWGSGGGNRFKLTYDGKLKLFSDALGDESPIITFIRADGSVGINTASPNAKLDVRGNAVFNEDAGNYDFRVEGVTNANLLFIDASEDKIGIGKGNPTRRLDVQGDICSDIGQDSARGFIWGSAEANRFKLTYDGALKLFSDALGDNTPIITFIRADGKVGINTASPGAKLDVSGDAKISGNLAVDTNVLFVDTSGDYVGIGTNTPGAKLEVSGGNLKMTSGNIMLNNNWLSGDGGNEGIYIDSSGQVGIGTSSPNIAGGDYRVLTIADTTNYGASLELLFGSGGVGLISFHNSQAQQSGKTIAYIHGGPDGGSNNAGKISFWTVDSYETGHNPLVLSNDGTLSITGTTSGTNPKVTIGNSSDYVKCLVINQNVDSPTSGTRGLDIVYGGASGRTSDNTELLRLYDANNASSKPMLNVQYAGTGTNVPVAVFQGGNVGIGTTNPGLLLTCNGSLGFPASSGSTQTGIFRIENTTNNTVIDMGIANNYTPFGAWIQAVDKSNLATERPLILNPNGGAVGIGVTSPAESLEVNGNTIISGGLDVHSGTIFVDPTNNRVGIGTITPSETLHLDSGSIRIDSIGQGDVYTDANYTLRTSSDERNKRVYGDVQYGLKEIMKLKPKFFNLKTDPQNSARNIGFIAQNVVEAGIIEAAPKDENGYYSLNSRGIIAALVNAVKEQQIQIEELKKAK